MGGTMGVTMGGAMGGTVGGTMGGTKVWGSGMQHGSTRTVPVCELMLGCQIFVTNLTCAQASRACVTAHVRRNPPPCHAHRE